MSYVVAIPAIMASAATDLERISSSLSAANAVAAAPTNAVVAAAGDEVSAGIASLFSHQAQEFQALSAQARTPGGPGTTHIGAAGGTGGTGGAGGSG